MQNYERFVSQEALSLLTLNIRYFQINMKRECGITVCQRSPADFFQKYPCTILIENEFIKTKNVFHNLEKNPFVKKIISICRKSRISHSYSLTKVLPTSSEPKKSDPKLKFPINFSTLIRPTDVNDSSFWHFFDTFLLFFEVLSLSDLAILGLTAALQRLLSDFLWQFELNFFLSFKT